MKKRSKLIIILAVVVVVVVIILANVLKSGEKTFAVEAEKVKRGDVTAVVSADGKIEPKTTVKISAYVPAKVVHLAVHEGDTVAKGQLLVQLDPTRYQAEVDRMQAQLRSEQASLEQAKIIYERQKQLFDKNLTSQQEYDMTKTNYDVTKSGLEQSKAVLDQAKDDLDKTTMTSPISGVVTELSVEEGEIAITGTMNNPGTVLMTVSDLSLIEIKAEVDETDVANVKKGQKVKVEIDAYPDTSFNGEVTEIGNTALVSGYGTQEQTTNFLVKVLLLDKVPGIKPGMSASVDITTEEHKNVLNVPIQAVVMRSPKDTLEIVAPTKEKKPKKTASADTVQSSEPKGKEKEIEGVFVIKDHKAVFIPVETGIADQQNIEIKSGLKDDDMVITGSYKILRTLKNRAKVKLQKEASVKGTSEKKEKE
ncbi:MAG: efflux RND transporter periplasmic adaptor subunit [candidate division Zixibacteria bacterium]|nr:efflux RND transporter periplasmic adaptor subunit [candidate division Zixibacteria bacterium]